MEKENCYACGALPCDWVDDPFKEQDIIVFTLSEIRQIMGVHEKPMLSDLAEVIRQKVASLNNEAENSHRYRKALQEIYQKWIKHEEIEGDDFDEGYSLCLSDVKDIAKNALLSNFNK